jgi:hypothetical protein
MDRTMRVRVSNSLDHLREEVQGCLDHDYRMNPELIALRSLIHEEVLSNRYADDDLAYTSIGLDGGHLRTPAESSRISVDRLYAPGDWAAEARRSIGKSTFSTAHPSSTLVPHESALPTRGLQQAPYPYRDEPTVDAETARQIESAEQQISSSWISRIFGVGGFRTDEHKRQLSKPLPKAHPPKTPPLQSDAARQHWIPEESIVSRQPEQKTDAQQVSQSADENVSATVKMLTAFVPEILKPASKEQGIVSSLGLVLSTNRDKEVIFVGTVTGSPADMIVKADSTRMLENDVLFAVDGEPVYKWDLGKVITKLDGPPETVVNLHFLRGNPDGADQEESIKKGKCKRTFVTIIRASQQVFTHLQSIHSVL